ncbi:MAG TPA: nucleotidyltransferase domain-containing protein [Anaerolineae bacterium]|nr:nucleotidyltransferase domain-containing protein [Anaerolineae bacterium]
MPKTAADLTSEEIEIYRQTARRRRRQEERRLTERRERAWTVARQAARLLKDRFGARRVVVFGSLAREGRFRRWSDLDLAVWGIRPEDYYRAVSKVLDMTTEFKIDLVDVTSCRPSLRAAIEREGIDLL